MDRRIKIRHLEAFVAIAEAKSLKRAAEELHLTQPTISKTLKDLEDILGVTLMDRGRAGVRLTSAGEVFVQFAQQSAAAVRQGLNSIATLGAAGGAILHIGVLPSAAAYIFPAATAQFKAASPDTVLHIEEGALPALISRLRAGDLDLVVGRLGSADVMAGLSFTSLYSETVIAVVAPDHPLIDATRLEQLEDTLVIYPPKDAAIRPMVTQLMISRGMQPFRKRIECVSGAFGRAMTLSDERPVWLISRGVVADDLATGRLVALDIDMGETQGTVGIMARSEEASTPIIHLFRQALLNAAESK